MDPYVEYRLSENNQMLHQHGEDVGVRVQMSAMSKEQGKQAEELNTADADAFATFMGNFETWNAQNALSSASNFDNVYFKGIVNMGKRAVPFIYEELKKGPTDLVYALDAIFGYPIKYEGFMPLEKSCEIWLSILRKIENRLVPSSV